VRHIAASAAGNFYFGQNLGALLEQDDRPRGVFLRAGDGRKKSGRASAEDNDGVI
jgi:hypothetical protein